MQSVIKNSKTKFIQRLKTSGKESPGRSSEDEKIVIIMRRNYECTRGHKRSVYKYSLHVDNREVDQEKQNKTVAR